MSSSLASRSSDMASATAMLSSSSGNPPPTSMVTVAEAGIRAPGSLDVWTGHGKYEVVPNMRGLTYNQASAALAAAGLNVELSDSIYDEHTQPGTVLDQSPRPNTKVKPNRVVYLTPINPHNNTTFYE